MLCKEDILSVSFKKKKECTIKIQWLVNIKYEWNSSLHTFFKCAEDINRYFIYVSKHFYKAFNNISHRKIQKKKQKTLFQTKKKKNLNGNKNTEMDAKQTNTLLIGI